MKKWTKTLFNASDIKDKQPDSECHSEPLPVPEDTSDSQFPETQPYVTSSNIEALRIRKCKNTFFISETRFSSDGAPHSVMISFENGGTKMHVKIDGRKIYIVDITEKVQGNEELIIDGMVVDFVWYLNRIPLRLNRDGSMGYPLVPFRSDIDAVEPSQRLNQVVPERTLGQICQHMRLYWLRGKKHGNGYLFSEAHFLPNGNLRDIVISFDGEERTKMMVAIDNKIISVLDIKDKLEGNTELNLNNAQYLSDRLVVNFKWDLSGETKFFRFYTKPLPDKKAEATGSISNNNVDNEQLGFIEDEFEGERSDTDALEPSHTVRRPSQLVPERTFGQDLQHSRFYAMRAEKHGNGYLISEAHFLPNGKLYDIFISFDGDERRKMMVTIDNKMVSELDIKDKLKGSIELYFNDGQYLKDKLVIVFKWDLSRGNKQFQFFTKPISHKTTTDSSSYNNGDNDHSDFDEEGLDSKCYACRLYVYTAE
ncbi:hypothetical protein MA16_Dca021588 [Dendrobium catenatum]|uniref:Uncharacterized protein n=1 Tax=Dendrobium catenatum TaxID=906689 RepID=A0A2I0VKM1_9ASPA|nr:hypothetical protein MA16_Dca021588 [Dendrobium catenatum]